MTNSRDIGLDHGAGKGDKDRSNRAKFTARFPAALTGKVDGFEQRGRRLVRVYGPRGGSRPVSYHAQRIADETNAGFRASGIDTVGH